LEVAAAAQTEWPSKKTTSIGVPLASFSRNAWVLRCTVEGVRDERN
jgi:hypothetical protein